MRLALLLLVLAVALALGLAWLAKLAYTLVRAGLRGLRVPRWRDDGG